MDNRDALVKYRLEQAEQCLKSAKILLETNDYKGAANRSYYCVFNSIRSLLAREGIDFKKHMAVINYFRKNYIKTNIFDVKLSDIAKNLFKIRTLSDYDDFYIVNKNNIIEQTTNAEYFLEQIKQYLKTIFEENLIK